MTKIRMFMTYTRHYILAILALLPVGLDRLRGTAECSAYFEVRRSATPQTPHFVNKLLSHSSRPCRHNAAECSPARRRRKRRTSPGESYAPEFPSLLTIVTTADIVRRHALIDARRGDDFAAGRSFRPWGALYYASHTNRATAPRAGALL